MLGTEVRAPQQEPAYVEQSYLQTQNQQANKSPAGVQLTYLSKVEASETEDAELINTHSKISYNQQSNNQGKPVVSKPPDNLHFGPGDGTLYPQPQQRPIHNSNTPTQSIYGHNPISAQPQDSIYGRYTMW